MATLAPGTAVALLPAARAALRFPPPGADPLHVAVHPDALRGPGNQLTQVVARRGPLVTWTGAIDERMLARPDDGLHRWPDAPHDAHVGAQHDPRFDAAARAHLAERLLTGERLWAVVRPGSLTADPRRPHLTVYHGPRPWVVVGALAPDAAPVAARDGDDGVAGGNAPLLAMPLNDARGPGKWYAPTIAQGDMDFAGNVKDSRLEMAHLWALPAHVCRVVGTVRDAARDALAASVARYFGRAPQSR